VPELCAPVIIIVLPNAAQRKTVENKPTNAQETSNPDAFSLGIYAERAYLDYAVSVVKGRALPDVCLLYTSDAADDM
jgi:hypothetical protein